MAKAAITTVGKVLDDTLDATRELVNKIEKSVGAKVRQTFEADGVLAVTAEGNGGFFGRFVAKTTGPVEEVAEGEIGSELNLETAKRGELDTKLKVRVEVELDRPALKGPAVHG